jgi:hypothetical protein
LLTDPCVTLRLIALAAFALCASTGARAFAVCEEDTNQSSLSEGLELELRREVEAAPTERPTERPAERPTEALPVVPCAMVESGVLGPACADASFYVVTDAGVMLCTVDIDTFSLTVAPARAVESAPAAPTGAMGFGMSVSALAPEGVALPSCLARELARADVAPLLPPRDRSDRPPVPPS